LPPRTLLNGRYLIGRLLGSGGFGNTHLYLETKLGMKQAIKEYLPYGLATRRLGETDVHVMKGDTQEPYFSDLDKFLEEAKTLARFNGHPGIVSIRNFFMRTIRRTSSWNIPME
jgi:serine/threonine protein kinase